MTFGLSEEAQGVSVVGGVVQEIEIPSGRVLFEWRSLDHVGLEESHVTPSEAHFDYFHVNSVDVDADGHLLISARHTWTVYKVHRRRARCSGASVAERAISRWGRARGRPGSATPEPTEGGRVLSIFDNGAAPQVQTQTRVILVRLDTERMQATLMRKYAHKPRRIVSRFMGNGQLLANGGVVVGWGSEPFVTRSGRGATSGSRPCCPRAVRTTGRFGSPGTEPRPCRRGSPPGS